MFIKLTYNDLEVIQGGAVCLMPNVNNKEGDPLEIGDTNEEIPNHFFDYCDDIFIQQSTIVIRKYLSTFVSINRILFLFIWSLQAVQKELVKAFSIRYGLNQK